MPSCSSWTTASWIGTRLSPSSCAISLRSTRSPERSLPVSTRLTTCETTRSFSLTPYFLGMARKASHVAAPTGAEPRCSASIRLATVAPAAQRLGLSQVVVGSVDADRQQCDPEVDERVGLRKQRVEAVALHACGALDGRRVTADVGTVPREDLRLRRVCLQRREPVPGVGVLRDQAQRLALTLATDQDWDVTRRRGVELGEPRLYPRHRGCEVVKPAACGAELVAVLVVVLLLPTRPDAEDQPAVRDVVDGAGHVGE